MAMEHYPAGTRPERTGPTEWFTGEVTLTPVMEAPAPARLRAVLVAFAPGARTHWHSHPLGQAIHVVAGRGRAQREGGPLVCIGPGDTVWFAPGEQHWHGADPDVAMTHLAMQEADGGVTVTWGQAVLDRDYRG
jgi:quercetin dioxygenase-like cupin family protein